MKHIRRAGALEIRSGLYVLFVLTIRIDYGRDRLLPDERRVHVAQERDAPQIQIQIEALVEERADVGRNDFCNGESHPEDDEQLCVQGRQDCGQGVAVCTKG